MRSVAENGHYVTAVDLLPLLPTSPKSSKGSDGKPNPTAQMHGPARHRTNLTHTDEAV